jgi:hypothetical protein
MDGDQSNARIAQASGMVSVQVDCTVDDALVLMQARADSDDRSLDAVARSVVHGDIRFDDKFSSN